MRVLVDTTIWSLALRRKGRGRDEQALVDQLTELINEARAVLVGPVRQEVLSGIRDRAAFELVRERLEPFDDLAIEQVDYVEAARLFNVCRGKGVQGSHIDFLICAVAMRHGVAVFTTDRDFARYAGHVDVVLHQVRDR